MPENETDFYYSFELIEYIREKQKKITIFLPDFKVNLLPDNLASDKISFNAEDITRFNLPTKSLSLKLSGKDSDIVIDLNRNENLFCSGISNILNTKYRIGFKKIETTISCFG